MAWKLGRGAPLPPSPIVVGDELAVVTGGTYSASPVFAGGSLFLRTDSHLYRIMEIL